MTTILTDTSADAEEVLVHLLSKAPVWKRLRMVEALNESLRALAMADLRRCYPEATKDELKKRLAARLLKPAEVTIAYGWDPSVEGY